MRVIGKEFGQPLEILKFNDYKGAACMVDEHTAETKTGEGESAATTPAYQVINGRKILKAGTPYPTNDNKCLGFLLHDTDVTDKERPATYIYEGAVDSKKITANKVTISAAAKTAVPRVTFFD